MASHIGRRKFLATPQLMRDRVREHDARRGVQAWIRGYCVTRRQRDNLRAPAGKNRVGTDQQCTAGLLHEVQHYVYRRRCQRPTGERFGAGCSPTTSLKRCLAATCVGGCPQRR